MADTAYLLSYIYYINCYNGDDDDS